MPMRIGYVLREYRLVTRQSLRELADEMDVPFVTLSRVERGFSYSADTLAQIMLWLTRDVVGWTNKKRMAPVYKSIADGKWYYRGQKESDCHMTYGGYVEETDARAAYEDYLKV